MFHPTEKFLLECIRTNSNKELLNILSNISKNRSSQIDWLIVAETISHIYLIAKENRDGFKISQKLLNEIGQKYLWNIAKNNLFKHEIKLLAEEFNKSKLDLIFLKGAALFTTVYDSDTDIRIMSDIDVLIPKDDLYKAEEILLQMGYQAKETKETRKIFFSEHFHFSYFKKTIPLELHWDIGEQWNWDLVERERPDKEMLFSLSVKSRLDDTEIQILSPAHSIFAACFHFERDLFLQHFKIISTPRIYLPKYKSEKDQLVFQSLKFFYEIKKMLKFYGDKMNWDDLFSLSKATEKEYEIFTLLFLAEKVAKVGIPEAVLDRMKKNAFVHIYMLICSMVKYESLHHLFVINRMIYRIMLIYSYIYHRKFYLLGMRFLGGRI